MNSVGCLTQTLATALLIVCTHCPQVIKELEYDTMNNPINFINRYIMLPANTTGNDTFSFVLDEDSLDEGYYKLSAKVALVSQFPDLVDLDGRTNIIQVGGS